MVAPYSSPSARRRSPSASGSSVGNGPPPTRVVYALAMPMTRPIGARRQPGARRRRAGDDVRRRDERIRAVVDVEHRALRALEQHALARAASAARSSTPVSVTKGREPLAIAGVALVGSSSKSSGGSPRMRLEVAVLLAQVALERLAEAGLVEQVADADADARHLVLVGRPDAAPGGADLALAAQALARLVDGAVVRHDEVRLLADPEPASSAR